jgi:hypothetical protein
VDAVEGIRSHVPFLIFEQSSFLFVHDADGNSRHIVLSSDRSPAFGCFAADNAQPASTQPYCNPLYNIGDLFCSPCCRDIIKEEQGLCALAQDVWTNIATQSWRRYRACQRKASLICRTVGSGYQHPPPPFLARRNRHRSRPAAHVFFESLLY